VEVIAAVEDRIEDERTARSPVAFAKSITPSNAPLVMIQLFTAVAEIATMWRWRCGADRLTISRG
jgi:hypothetical protein